MFEQKVIRYINEKRLFLQEDKVLVALSGGADSVALLRVLLNLGYTCMAAHCNFHLRGEESDRDEAFVHSLCDRLDIPLYRVDFDTEDYASRRGISIEMAARELRYDWFEQIRTRIGAKVTAVAHHRDDSVETFLLNLVRGTGISGLHGIAAVNGTVVRPLLEVSHEEIIQYLKELGQNYVIDSTNLEDEFTRNKLRLNVIPLLKEINPSVCEAISETSRRLADVEQVYRKSIEAACKRIKEEEGKFNISRIVGEIAPQAVLFELLHPYGFNAAQLKDIYRSLEAAEAGKLFYAGKYVLLRDRDYLYLKEREEGQNQKVLVLHQDICKVESGFEVPRTSRVAYLDAVKIKEPLVLRRWQPGDRFIPFGMQGFKKVSDYLCDRKFSLFQKENQYVVCSGEDIVWLVNERTDNRFRVTEHTQRVLILCVE